MIEFAVTLIYSGLLMVLIPYVAYQIAATESANKERRQLHSRRVEIGVLILLLTLVIVLLVAHLAP
jgi:hypothetical protein